MRVPLSSALFFMAITATGTRYAGFALAFIAAFTVRTFAIWIRAASVFYHGVHLLRFKPLHAS